MFQFIFAIGTWITVWSFGKILEVFNLNKNNLLIINIVWVWLLGFLYVYNPWTLERFLMGQYYVLAGYMLMPLGIFLIIRLFDQTNDVLNSTKNQSWQVLGFLIVLSLINIHQVFMLGMVWIFWFVFEILSCQLILNEKKAEVWISGFLDNFWRWSWFWIPVIALNLFQYWKQVGDSFGTYRTDIIQAFGLQIQKDQNIWVRALIGSGSWNSQSLVEVYSSLNRSGRISIESYLGDWAQLTIYFNIYFAFSLIILVAGVWTWICYRVWVSKNWRDQKWFGILSFLGLLGLVLNFGFININQYFYALPLTYIMRESGKFYSLFWLCMILILVIYYKFLSKWLQFTLGLFLSLVLIGNLALFLSLPKVINYYDFPEIYKKINESCSQNDRLLFLPLENYNVTSYSPQVFVASALTKYLKCKTVEPQISLQDNSSGSWVILKQSSESQQILELVENLSDGQLTAQELLQTIRSLGITQLIVEEFQNPKLQEFNQILKKSNFAKTRRSNNQLVFTLVVL